MHYKNVEFPIHTGSSGKVQKSGRNSKAFGKFEKGQRSSDTQNSRGKVQVAAAV